jgi:CSLREA domain-containing protein
MAVGFIRGSRLDVRCAILVAVGIVCGISAAGAAMIPVNSTADDTAANGNCTLREAVIAANTDSAVDACPAGSSADVITVPAGTYVLTQTGGGEDAAATGDLDLLDDVEILGAGAATTIVDGNLSDRVFDVSPTGPPATAALTGITVRNGGSVSGIVFAGGGIQNAGTLTVTDSVITGNTASSPDTALGGGVSSTGTLLLTNITVSGNAAVASSIMASPHSAAGGGIACTGSTTIVNSTIDGNTSTAMGPSPFTHEAEGGGIFSSGLLTITGSTIRDNVATVGESVGAAAGGGIATDAELTLTNSTLSGNTAVNEYFITPYAIGGAMALGGDATITNATIADNHSLMGAVSTSGSSTVTFRNTILADNGIENCDTAFSTGTIVGNAYNLEAGNSCGFSGTDLVNVAPLLGPLQDNGGPTFTHLPGVGSPAREAGNPAIPGSGGSACPATDQRGIARPQFTRCDIGSVEVEKTDVCAAPPLSGCDTPGKSLLLIKDHGADGAGAGDKLIWKWLKGPATAQADFGDPTTTAEYTLCIYAGTTAAIRADIPAGGACGSGPCWKPIGDKGYKRTDPAAGTAGIKKVLLKGSDVAKAKILVKGQGAALDLDPTTLPLAAAAGLTVQLSHSDNTSCWQAIYAPASVKTNSESMFKAKSP